MQTTGIIAEYNPFHNGHLYQAERAREETEADVVIAMMSGPFLQRGEPALTDPWTRAQMALRGVDVVIQLPYRYATGIASTFAEGGVSLLAHLGVTTLSFGSEHGEASSFLQAARQITDESNEAVDRTFNETFAHNFSAHHAIEAIDITEPNNNLGFHYARANERLREPLTLHTVSRKGAAYEETTIHGAIASATAIRQTLKKDGLSNDVRRAIPESTALALQQFNEQATFGSWETFYPYLRLLLLRATPEQIASIYTVREGIEHRLLRAAERAGTFEQFMASVKTKRYTWTSIQRMLTHVLTNTAYEMIDASDEPLVAHLLAANERGRRWIQQSKKQFSVPLLSTLAQSKQRTRSLDDRAIAIYTHITNSYFGSQTVFRGRAQPPHFSSFGGSFSK